ncbi:MAG: response regulator [Desulfobacterales bacterium]|nr:response regulator [Desulfobacterales bacterium]MCP4162172.1 response regulator [Deltaproteobacteria bacterium]
MPKEHILAVDDEEDILELIQFNLNREGYKVSCAISGEDALRKVSTKNPDLILLDLMLPDLDGFAVARRLKEDPKRRHIPIIMLTAKGEESDIVTGLELGADDYIVKPFSPRILIARVRTLLRRIDSKDSTIDVLEIKDLVIDPIKHIVMVKGEAVELTVSEFQILYFLAKKPGWVFTRSKIVDEIRGNNYAVTDRSVDVQIVGLRKKLKECGTYIETVRGVGYRFGE